MRILRAGPGGAGGGDGPGEADSPVGRGAATKPRVTFGMIVLNGEPFTRYNLRSLYPWAHQIIVVEGACKAAAGVAGADGHSTDGTLEALQRFKAEEDPEDKLTIVTAEDQGHPDGFWPGEKDEMSRAYANRATGNYLWQVDVDEFYCDEDMPRILQLLNRGSDAVTFPTLLFWGGIQILEDGEYMRVHRGREFHRIFRWGAGFRYTRHRPPTVVDALGRDLRSLRWAKSKDLERKGIRLYHYSMLLPKQVREKCLYYSRVDWAAFPTLQRWAQETFFERRNLFRVCSTLNVPLSWLEEYSGGHPRQLLNMMEGIRAGRHVGIELRPTEDILRDIRTAQYRVGRALRKAWVCSMVPSALRRALSVAARAAGTLPWHHGRRPGPRTGSGHHGTGLEHG